MGCHFFKQVGKTDTHIHFVAIRFTEKTLKYSMRDQLPITREKIQFL
jgi:hypothetical protein